VTNPSSTPAAFPAATHANGDLWVVVIGRNEGERLVRCFDSLRSIAAPIVYVDSASTDGSVAMARARGIEVVELDMSIPFTAARARNEGVARLRKAAAPARWVQFIDGDCEIIDGWFAAAMAHVERDPSVVCVCGGVRERFPERSVYNRIADLGATGPSGEIVACGGIAMMRTDFYEKVGGFRDDLFTGEERELCVRMRKEGGRVWRLAVPMAWHDSAMLQFGQWWRRTRRGGYTFAQATSLFGKDDRSVVRQAFSAGVWGGVFPLGVLALSVFVSPWALLLFLIYPLQILRVAMAMSGPMNARLWGASFMVLGKFPELIGLCQYWTSGSNPAALTRSFQKS
jgi:GT2 family glycosyltransferase